MATFSYIWSICCDIADKNELILFLFGTVIRYNVLLTHVKYPLGSMPNVSNYTNIFLKFYVYNDISEKNGLILVIFGTVINHNRDLMHAKYTLTLCQKVAFMSIIS